MEEQNEQLNNEITTVNAEDIAKATPKIEVPQPQEPTRPSQFVDALDPAITQSNENLITAKTTEAESRNDLLNRLMNQDPQSTQDVFNDSFSNQIEQTTGQQSGDFLQRLSDENVKLAQLQGKFRRSGQQVSSTAGSKIQEGIELGELSRQEAVEVGNQALLVQALQGNYNSARQIALDTAKFATEDRQMELDNLITQYNALDGIVQGQEKQLIDQAKAEAEAEKAELERTQTAVDAAITSGVATPEEMQQLTSTTVPDEDKQALAQTIVSRGETRTRNLDEDLKRQQLKNIKSQISERDSSGSGGSGDKDLTSSQFQAKGFGERMLQASMIIDEVGNDFTGTISRVTGSDFFPTGFKSSNRQRYEQAQKNFVNAVLRRESGAAIADSEFENAAEQYFPQPGDKDAVLIQKKQNRDLVIKNMLDEAGIDTEPIQQSLNDPLGLGIGVVGGVNSTNDNPLDL